MNGLLKALVLLLFGVMLWPASILQTANAASSFTTEEQPKFTFPLPDNAGNVLSFLLFSTEGEINNTTVQVRQVKTPDGQLLPLDAVKASLETAKVSPQGVKVSLTPDPKFFAAPGDYRVILFFQGGKGSPNLASTIVLNHPVANINLEELQDQTVALTRYFPVGSASDSFTFYMRESTGKAALKDLKVFGQSIHIKDTKELVPGEVSAALLPDDPPKVISAATAMNAVASGPKAVKVTFSGLRYAGAFDTKLLVTSPSFSADKIIPLKVTVQDFVLWPLLAIALGVVGGYWTRRIASVLKPRNENNFQLLRLQNEVDRYRELVKSVTSVETIQSLLSQLKTARESNEAGDFALARAALPKIQEQLNQFRATQAQAQAAVQTTLNSLLTQSQVLEQSGTLSRDESSTLHSINDRLTDVERLLRQGLVDDAQDKIGITKQLLADLRVRKFTNYFTLLKSELIKLNLTDPAALKTAETLKSEIQTLLNSNELDDKVRSKLEEFKDFIEEQKERSKPRGARETEGEADDALPEVPTALPAARPLTYIKVNTPVDRRITGDNVSFTIEDPEQIIRTGDKFQWYFGEVGSFVNGIDTSHRYQASGQYQVRVDIIRNESPAKTLYEKITVLPGQIERARAGILQDILRNEKILSWIALLLAIVGGVIFLYSGKLFGSLVDYLMAILWGFGLDNTVKGFAGVLGKISSTEGPA